MTVLFAAASIVACAAPAAADPPGAPVLAGDNVTPAPAAEVRVGAVRTVRRSAGRSETLVTARTALREHNRTQPRQKARHRGGSRVVAGLLAHHDGADVIGEIYAKAEAPDGADLIVEARRWIGTNPTGRAQLWCARFMNFVLKRLGYSGTASDMANSFASYGQRLAGPRIGAIAVMTRGRNGGHVGVVTGFAADGNPIIISGNHSSRVAEAVYPKTRVYAYVAPES